jgi:propane monooxygenase reductase subunit
MAPRERALRLAGSGILVPDQIVNLEIPGTDEVRSYSIANTPHVSDRIQLVVKLLPGGTFSGHLRSRLAVGDRLRVFGPLGELKLRLSHRRVLVVAGGSGLAPFLSMLRHLEARGKPRDVDLVYGARRVRDLYRVEELERLAAVLPGVRFVPRAVRTGGRAVGGRARARHRRDRPDVPDARGVRRLPRRPPAMTEATVPVLTRLGVRPANVRFDAFVPARP